jgi:hypothetical protein
MLDAERESRKKHDEDLHDCVLRGRGGGGGKMCQVWERREMMKLYSGLNLKKRDRKKDVGFHEIILLKRTLKKEDGRMRT